MNHFPIRKRVLKTCHIYTMLAEHAKGRHLSFHTPGHKVGAWDLTELDYSDNLSCPNGCIAEAESDVSALLGSAASFLLTDGSTCGVLSMLLAAKSLGVGKLVAPRLSHKSVFNGCKLLGVELVLLENPLDGKIPLPPPVSAFERALSTADGAILVSPDYYGNVPDLSALRALCDREKKLLLIDGAHGGHLRFDRRLYAGAYADLWVDGVHKSLPALTQGAVVSARTKPLAEKLRSAVDTFRTTSPSYPVMASVEYAVRYPRNPALEKQVSDFAARYPSYLRLADDWTKLVAIFGENSFSVKKELEKSGIYAEFCDGNAILFYLSPATSARDFRTLKRKLSEAFRRYPPVGKDSLSAEGDNASLEAVRDGDAREKGNEKTEYLPPKEAIGRICARDCGLFPPCTRLLSVGDPVTEEKANLLSRADNAFGLRKGKIAVFSSPCPSPPLADGADGAEKIGTDSGTENTRSQEKRRNS